MRRNWRSIKLVEGLESRDFASSLGGNLNNIAEIDMRLRNDSRPRTHPASTTRTSVAALKTGRDQFIELFLDIHLTNLIESACRSGDSTGRAETQLERSDLRDADWRGRP